MTILSPLPVDPHSPAAILPDLEAAIAEQACFLPLPLADATRATLLRNTQRAGEPIDPGIALVMSTSGSTGTPKGAQLTSANLVASADATHQVLGGTGLVEAGTYAAILLGTIAGGVIPAEWAAAGVLVTAVAGWLTGRRVPPAPPEADAPPAAPSTIM